MIDKIRKFFRSKTGIGILAMVGLGASYLAGSAFPSEVTDGLVDGEDPTLDTCVELVDESGEYEVEEVDGE